MSTMEDIIRAASAQPEDRPDGPDGGASSAAPGAPLDDAMQARTVWLAERRTGIGGSDAAAALGLNRWKSTYQLWLEKTGQEEEPDLNDVEAVRWGNLLENVVAQEYATRTGRTVHRVNRILRHPQHSFMLANVDRRVVGERRGLECKTAGFWAGNSEDWGPSGTDNVPEHYLVQVMHYLAVTGYEVFDLAVLIGGQDFRIYSIPRNEALIAAMIERERIFWHHVEEMQPPAPTTMDDARRRWPRSLALTIEASADIASAEEQLRVIESEIKDFEAAADVLKAKIASYMGESDTLTFGGRPLRTFKTQQRSILNQGRLKDLYPEAYQVCLDSMEIRIMRAVKASKKGEAA